MIFLAFIEKNKKPPQTSLNVFLLQSLATKLSPMRQVLMSHDALAKSLSYEMPVVFDVFADFVFSISDCSSYCYLQQLQR